MKRIKLTKKEKETENALLRGDYVRVTGRELEEVRESLISRKKDMAMTIRVNSEDIKKIRRKASKIGVRYQTFISEVLHRVALQ